MKQEGRGRKRYHTGVFTKNPEKLVKVKTSYSEEAQTLDLEEAQKQGYAARKGFIGRNKADVLVWRDKGSHANRGLSNFHVVTHKMIEG